MIFNFLYGTVFKETMEINNAGNKRAVWKHLIALCANDFIGLENNIATVDENSGNRAETLEFKEADFINFVECNQKLMNIRVMKDSIDDRI